MIARILATLLVVLTTVGASHAEAGRLHVVASFSILADMAKQIGGNDVEVTSLVPPGGDPHTYEPTPDDARRLHEADLVLINGLGLEGWMERLVAASGPRGQIVTASAGLIPLTMQENGHSVVDPHAWNSAANGILYARNIETALIKIDPGKAEDFHQRAAALIAVLTRLDEEARHDFKSVPPGQRKVLTTHDALGYFGHAYGLTFLSPLGLTTDNEPSAKTVAAMIQQIRLEHVTQYFLENSVDSRLAKQIAAATGAKQGGTLFVESLSPPGGPAATYPDMFRHNMTVLLAAVRGQ
ncbi:metal ABC transporter substrate-binding protein [Granulibacter bethesdensis]|uniref:metal ABC transporter substrate-binding protein n=1 Tax=Granulibacter bethesdensis TaxID=364410 RepID=UPI0003F1E9FF|nr:metal ABC transporter substrate-binding protein [Granulibacter bethesdensis]AHJ66419.1 Manganese-binding protein [Granulibacter bethesdensis CGDNIH4]